MSFQSSRRDCVGSPLLALASNSARVTHADSFFGFDGHGHVVGLG
jgi:hypothetical protein